MTSVLGCWVLGLDCFLQQLLPEAPLLSPHLSLSAGLDRPLSYLNLPYLPSPQDEPPQLYTVPPVTHLAFGVIFATLLRVQPLHQALSLPQPHPSSIHTQSVAPSLCTPADSQLQAHGGPQPKVQDPPALAATREAVYVQAPPHGLQRIKHLETQGSGG